MIKRLSVCLVIVASLALASVAMTSNGIDFKKVSGPSAQVGQFTPIAVTSATSAPFRSDMEALTPKAGVVFFRIVAKVPFGQQDAAIIAIGGERNGTIDTSTIIAIGTKMRSTGTIISAGWEKPGCDIVAGFGQVNKYGQVKGVLS